MTAGGPPKEAPPPNPSGPEGAPGQSKPGALPNQEKPAWFKRLPGIGSFLSRGKPREALEAAAKLDQVEPVMEATSPPEGQAEAVTPPTEAPVQPPIDSGAETIADGISPQAPEPEVPQPTPAPPEAPALEPGFQAVRDAFSAMNGGEPPPGTIFGRPEHVVPGVERQPQEIIDPAETNQLPGQKLIKEGAELPHYQLSEEALNGTLALDISIEDTDILVINQQGEVIAYTFENMVDSPDREHDQAYDRDQILIDIQERLNSQGLTSYRVIYDRVPDSMREKLDPNPDSDQSRSVYTTLEDLTGGKGVDDYSARRAIVEGNNADRREDVERRHISELQTLNGVTEVRNLVADPAFQERFIGVQIAPERAQLLGISAELNQAVDARLKPLVEQAAMEALGLTDLNAARKLGKAWGEALRNVSSVTISAGETDQYVSTEDAKSLLRKQLEPSIAEKTDQAQKSLVEAEQRQRELLTQLQQEIEARASDPEFIAAMEVWGRSPDSRGNRGIDGSGLNAGVIHYFEYRADSAKNGRYKKSDTEVSVQGFIDYSMRMKALIDNPNPATNPDIQTAGMIEDARGQRRLYLLTRDGSKIVGFMKSGEPMRIITIIPGANEKAIQKDLSQEMGADPNDPTETARLNHLGEGRRMVELTEPADLTETEDKFKDFKSTIEQRTTRGDGRVLPGEAFQRSDIDFHQALDHLRIHTEGAVAGSQFNGAIFEDPAQIRHLLEIALPESLQYDQYGRAELTLDITHPGSEPIGWTGVKSTEELEQSGGVIEKRMRIPGGVEDIVDGIKGAWYPEMVYDQIQGKMVIALDQNGNVRNARGKFEPEVNVATVSQEEFQDTSKTNKLTVILQKDKLTGKPVVLTAFPGENAPPVPSRLNITVVEPGEQAEIIDNLQNPVMKDYWEDHAFIQTS